MDTKFGVVISLSGVLLWILTNTSIGPFVTAEEENYHVVECVLPHYFLCENGNCLPESHICDGENDCSDSSDENPSMCAQLSCNQTTEFKCASGRCVPKESRCDRVPQCRDRSDELDCVYEPCPKGQFSCANHSQCLEMSDVCDGSIDCKDGLASDELHPYPCPANVTCPAYAFKCKGTNVCALPNWMCDGENDCGDSPSSDEDRQNCKNFQCPEDWFRCADDRCIPMSNVCNGVIDCKDGLASDERHPNPCPKNVTCPADFFSCDETNICAHPHWLCDGTDDCGDRSDENLERCASTPCPEEWFRCKSQRCIPPNWRCDGSPDCPTSEDEDDCENYYNQMFLADNNTVLSYLNYTEQEEYENVNATENGSRKPIQLDNEKTNKQLEATKPAAALAAHKQKSNPISSYANSQSNNLPKSSKSTPHSN